MIEKINMIQKHSIRHSYSLILSQDYARLWSLICSREIIVGVLDVTEYGFKNEKMLMERLASIKRTDQGFLAIGSTGVGYSGGMENYEEFLGLCKLYNLSFLDNNYLKAEICETTRSEE